jgi:hypothetical protein
MSVLCSQICGHMEAFKLVYSDNVTEQVELYCDGIALTST